MLPANGLYGHIRNNNLKSALLLAGFIVLMATFWYSLCVLWSAVAWSPAGPVDDASLERHVWLVAVNAAGVARGTWALPVITGLVWLALAYTFHAGMIRAATGTKELTRREHPRLHTMVERIAIGAMMISNPFERLFSTHPSIADRVDRLRRFAGGHLPEPTHRPRLLDPFNAPEGARGWGIPAKPEPAATGFLRPAFGRRRGRLGRSVA